MRPSTEEEYVAFVRSIISDELESKKSVLRINNRRIGEALGVSEKTVSRIISGDNVKISLDQAITLLLLSGVRIVRRRNDG